MSCKYDLGCHRSLLHWPRRRHRLCRIVPQPDRRVFLDHWSSRGMAVSRSLGNPPRKAWLSPCEDSAPDFSWPRQTGPAAHRAFHGGRQASKSESAEAARIVPSFAHHLPRAFPRGLVHFRHRSKSGQTHLRFLESQSQVLHPRASSLQSAPGAARLENRTLAHSPVAADAN